LDGTYRASRGEYSQLVHSGFADDSYLNAFPPLRSPLHQKPAIVPTHPIFQLPEELDFQVTGNATNQELASGVRTRTLVSHCRTVVVLVLALPGLRSPGSDELAAYGRAADLLNFMDYPRQNVALRSLKQGALNVGADLLLRGVVIVVPAFLWFLMAHFVFQSLGRPEC